ncbi:NAD(P)H-binding protein [Aquamicrobium sp. LC103]|uniref:NAD(P)H-binding protein n=1 Tax=Aquamicrobium sp. LC103 TaxID=1120658 RepID=UPI000B3119C0|nr:NAD(P)H-binding protein [Aquamicrobium sp. LC103]
MSGISANEQAPVLLIGGLGKTGSRVAERLKARNVSVRLGSRSARPAFDWLDRSTWAPALEGADAAYVTYYPDLAVPGAADAVGALAKLAVEHGLRKLVLLSGRGEREAQEAEAALARSGGDWTVVRAAWFAQNFSENFFVEGIASGEVIFPADEVREPFVDAEDIADIAAAALTEPGHEGRIYEVTGPRLMRFDEAIAEIAEAAGRKVRYVPVSVDEYLAGLRQAGLPEDLVGLLGILTREVLDGRNSYITEGVQQALGRPPRDFRDYAARTAASGVWG